MTAYTGLLTQSYYRDSPYRQSGREIEDTPLSSESRARVDLNEFDRSRERSRNPRRHYVVSSPERTEDSSPAGAESPSRILKLKTERSLSVELISTQDQLASQSAPKAQPRMSNTSAHPKHSSFSCATPHHPSAVSSASRDPCMNNIRFQFFVSDQNFGAIEKSFDQCVTLSSFFDEALSAWGVIGGRGNSIIMAGVTVVIKSIPRPIFVLWRNKEGFERLMESIRKESVGRGEGLEIEVRCRPEGSQC